MPDSEAKKARDKRYYHANLEKCRLTQKLYRIKNHVKIAEQRLKRKMTLKGLA